MNARRSVTRTAVSTCLVLVVLAGCSPDGEPAADEASPATVEPAPPPTPATVQTTTPATLPTTTIPPPTSATTSEPVADPCSPSESEQIVERFADASRREDASAAAALFAQGTHFEWFSATSSADHYVTRKHVDLEDRFRQRFQAGERFELKLFNWNGPVQDGNINFDFEMRWTNPEFDASSGDARGKGAISCWDGSIIVLSIAMEPLSPGPSQNT